MQGTLMRKRVLYPPPLTRSPSFHMEGGLGQCKLVGLSHEKKAVDDAPQKPSFSERGGTTVVVGDSRRV